jgi:hypothetical protein
LVVACKQTPDDGLLIDRAQTYALRGAGGMFCRDLHDAFARGERAADCSITSTGIMTYRNASEQEDDSMRPFQIASLWCEGNLYSNDERRFQLLDADGKSCEQLCDPPGRDQPCVLPEDIGWAARRTPNAWPLVMVAEIVSLPSERAEPCTANKDNAEPWLVKVLDVNEAHPSYRGVTPVPLVNGPVKLWVVCPDSQRPMVGARIRADVASSGDECMPWAHTISDFCTARVRQAEK